MSDLGFSNLGFLNVSFMYGGFALSSMTIAIPINKKLGTKLTLFVSGLSYAIWISGFLLPAYKYEEEISMSVTPIKIINLLGALVFGLGAGPLWVSQAAYIA